MFELHSNFPPRGDQQKAIESLVEGLKENNQFQTLLGITGSGKTFTIANVVKQYGKPTLILSHNKTLAAQLFNELKSLFPNNLVEYYVSYYDYFKPESYNPASNVYLAKTLKINNDLEKLRMGAIYALLSGRKDVIVVASVSCIYGVESPEEFKNAQIKITIGDVVDKKDFIFKLEELFYEKKEDELKRGEFRVKKNCIDIFISHEDFIYKIIFKNDVVSEIQKIDPLSSVKIKNEEFIFILSTKLFGLLRDKIEPSIKKIEKELEERVLFFEKLGKKNEAIRIRERTEYDIKMIREVGYCSGIENYDMHFENRKPGERAACLFDYFPEDFLTIIDESHVTIPQFKAMYEGNKCRKMHLIDNGFRLPSAYEHRPLKFDEFEKCLKKTIFVSATPGKYELEKSNNKIVEQIIRPTGLLDPEIEVHPSKDQINEIFEEIKKRVEVDERVFITTLTKKMAEELNDFLVENGVKSQFLHSSVKTLDRVKILENIQKGVIDVIVGVNLLREGLDIPEVSLVMILDADKEGFLRNETSLIQTIGRAARNIHGKVILFADILTDSMKNAVEKTNYRRRLQMQYNIEHNITPQTTKKISSENFLVDKVDPKVNFDFDEEKIKKMNVKEVKKLKKKVEKEMLLAAKKLNFNKADKFKEKLDYLNKIIEKF